MVATNESQFMEMEMRTLKKFAELGMKMAAYALGKNGRNYLRDAMQRMDMRMERMEQAYTGQFRRDSSYRDWEKTPGQTEKPMDGQDMGAEKGESYFSGVMKRIEERMGDVDTAFSAREARDGMSMGEMDLDIGGIAPMEMELEM